MNEKIQEAGKLIIEARKLLLEVLKENTEKVPNYSDNYTDKLFDASKMLLEVSRKIN